MKFRQKTEQVGNTPVPATNNTKTAAYIIERSFLSIVSENEHCSYSLID